MGTAISDNRIAANDRRSSRHDRGSSSPNLAPWQTHYPFSSRWCPIAGHQLHYLDEGPASRPAVSQEQDPPDRAVSTHTQTLLLVHGNPTWTFHWRELVRNLRDEYRCVAVDHLGCGLSDKSAQTWRLQDRIDHLCQLVEILDLRNVTLVAQDWGGAIGLGTLLRQRDRFRRIVLLNTGAFRPWFIPWRIRVCRAPLVGKIALQGFGLFSRAAVRMTISRRRRLPPDIEAGYLAPYCDWPARRAIYDFVQDIPTGPGHPTWQTLSEIEDSLPALAHLPTLLVWGMKDWCFTPECLRRFTMYWPDAQVHQIEDAGHWVVEDAAAEVQQVVTDFLNATNA